MSLDPAKIAAEVEWLKDHPQFQEKPATIREFLGPDYLNLGSKIRAGLVDALESIFGSEVSGERIAPHYERAMLTGAIGIGKTTFASIALPYMAHWVLCLKNPQDYFGLLDGSRIAFMQMSTSEQQAAEVVFGDIFARIKHSPWFVKNYPYDEKFTKQIRFPKDIWILPGDSRETTFEGYNILGGILDEMDSHKVTADKDYADVGYDTIHSRIASRFPIFTEDGEEAGHKGLLICIGQMKKASGFAAKKYKEFLKDDRAYVLRMTIWESFGWQRYTRPDGTRNSFWYDIQRKQIIPTAVVEMVKNSKLIEVPNAYRKDFENNPEKALRDLAGIPPEVNDPFISLTHKIDICREKWIEKHGDQSPVKPNPTRIEFEDWFRANGDPRKRHIHIDLATSGDGDALGMAMGHVDRVVEVENELKPYIILDALMRVKAMPGTEIFISDIRRIIYTLKEDFGFKIISVSMDGFQSTDTLQQLRKKRYMADYLSVDKSTLPYEDLREAIYEERIEFPKYLTYKNKGDTEMEEIAVRELQQLTDTGKKIDHPEGGSKDIADAMAGVTTTLMGDRTYRRGVHHITASQVTEEGALATGTDNVLPFPTPSLVPPPITPGGFGLTIPNRLRPR